MAIPPWGCGSGPAGARPVAALHRGGASASHLGSEAAAALTECAFSDELDRGWRMFFSLRPAGGPLGGPLAERSLFVGHAGLGAGETAADAAAQARVVDAPGAGLEPLPVGCGGHGFETRADE